jgi:hypothetical protein
LSPGTRGLALAYLRQEHDRVQRTKAKWLGHEDGLFSEELERERPEAISLSLSLCLNTRFCLPFVRRLGGHSMAKQCRCGRPPCAQPDAWLFVMSRIGPTYYAT